MKSLVIVSGVSLALSLAAFAGCSSSTSTTTPEDSGTPVVTNNDSGSTQTGSDAGLGTTDSGGNTAVDSGGSSNTDAGSCAPTPIADGGVPTYTAPTLAQGACQATDISAFATACNDSAASSACGTWAQSNATTACGMCLLSQTSTIAPFETLALGNENFLLPSVGACVLAQAGSAAAACAVDLDEGDYCLNAACGLCSTSTQDSCSTTASSGECANAGPNYETDCASYAAIVKSCAAGNTSLATLTATATAICGSGATDAGDQ